MISINFSKDKSLLNSREVQDFIRLYARTDNWHNLDLKTANLGYGFIHYALIRVLKPRQVLCIGSRYGLIPAVCALACRDNRFGQVDFVDAGYDQNNPRHQNHWGGVGFWTRPAGQHAFAKFGLNDYLKLYVMTSRQFQKKYPRQTWGYIHLDGDHSYLGVRRDFQSFWPRLARPGIMALHDIRTPRSLGNLTYGVARFWRELKSAKKYQLLELPGLCGLGLIQK